MRSPVATRRRRAGIAAAVFGLAALVIGGRASAYVSAGGNSCQANGVLTVNYNYFGIETSQTTGPANVWCPLNLGAESSWGYGYSGIVMNFRDASSTDQFRCFVYQAFNDGTYATSTTKYTCSTGGGCNDLTTTFTGRGYLSWNSSDLSSNLTTQWTDTNYGIYCLVPAKATSTSDPSYVHSYLGW